jgi:anti-sigma B factor antagonist
MRSMQMTERHLGNVTIVDLTGTIATEADATRLKDKVDSLVRQQRTSVVLNLAEISYIDSSGLGQLAASYTALVKAGGGLKLLHVNKRNHYLLSITRLVTIFQVFDSEDEALRSFETAPAVSAAFVAS